jgi:hypothetical protein
MAYKNNWRKQPLQGFVKAIFLKQLFFMQPVQLFCKEAENNTRYSAVQLSLFVPARLDNDQQTAQNT